MPEALKAAHFLLRLSSLGVLTLCQLLFRLFHVYTHLLCTSGHHSCALSETGWIQSWPITLCMTCVQESSGVYISRCIFALCKPLLEFSHVNTLLLCKC